VVVACDLKGAKVVVTVCSMLPATCRTTEVGTMDRFEYGQRIAQGIRRTKGTKIYQGIRFREWNAWHLLQTQISLPLGVMARERFGMWKMVYLYRALITDMVLLDPWYSQALERASNVWPQGSIAMIPSSQVTLSSSEQRASEQRDSFA
jgi:hypothetical protein